MFYSIFVRRIFFILLFFIGYILSLGLVRLRTIWLSARVGTDFNAGVHACGEEVTITDVIIKTLDRKLDWGCEWCHAREVMGWDSWVFYKNQLVEIWTKMSPVVCCGVCARWLGQWVESWRRTNSQHRKIVSLSPHVENLKVKKVIKVSYLNQESHQCFRIPMCMNILHIWIFQVSVSWIYYILS